MKPILSQGHAHLSHCSSLHHLQNGRTPLFLAVEKGVAGVLVPLLRYGCSPLAIDNCGYSVSDRGCYGIAGYICAFECRQGHHYAPLSN